jgi:hypothetical protein
MWRLAVLLRAGHAGAWLALTGSLLAILASNLAFPGQAGAMDPVRFIVENNPEIQAVAKYNKSWLKDLKVSTKASAGMATPNSSGSEDDGTYYTGNLDPSKAEWEYEVKVIAELPLISPKEKMDFKLKEHSLRRQIRREAAQLITEYMALKSWVRKEEAIISDMVEELAWIEKRVQHGLESQKDFIGQTLSLKERMQKLEQKKVELRYKLVDILSFVSRKDRDRLTRLVTKLK